MASKRFGFIDDMRGLVVVMMGLGHASYYFHSMWKSLDYTDPFFDNLGQFLIRYQGYLCAPGFLILAGAMVWLSYFRGRNRGVSQSSLTWKFIKRGLFLILVQITWVNASWGAFAKLRLFHMGIIGCIGFSVIILSFLVSLGWRIRLLIGGAITILLPVLTTIPYDDSVMWQWALAQTFLDAGSFNVYPVVPWFALAILGSVMAEGWFYRWNSETEQARNTLFVGFGALLLGTIIRVIGMYGNTFAYDGIGTFSFFIDQKYPPNIVHNLWVFGAVVIWCGIFIMLGQRAMWIRSIIRVYGSVPFFFYLVHIPLLAFVTKRLGLWFRSGGMGTALLGWIGLLIVMYPLCSAYGTLRRKTSNPIIRMI